MGVEAERREALPQARADRGELVGAGCILRGDLDDYKGFPNTHTNSAKRAATEHVSSRCKVWLDPTGRFWPKNREFKVLYRRRTN